ncbi:MAG: nucleotidyltransferase domain-containing protein [Patescibacteria group bacterium]|nr:nucleotidyltransferase domain-containing protein [Patescibacteria group bacterium]
MVRKRIPKKVKKEIERYIDILKEDRLPIKKVVLFGSFARGSQRKWSDIDLCVVSPKFKNSFEASQYLWKKRKIFDLNYTIEPVGFNLNNFNDKYDSLANEIRKTGVEIEIKN